MEAQARLTASLLLWLPHRCCGYAAADGPTAYSSASLQHWLFRCSTALLVHHPVAYNLLPRCSTALLMQCPAALVRHRCTTAPLIHRLTIAQHGQM
jgi:hypothetical protein